MVRTALRNAPAGRRIWALCLVGACLAALPVYAAGGKLPALHRWRFSHPIDMLQVATARDLGYLFAAKNYSLDALANRETIPRIYLLRLVDGLRAVQPVSARETLFIRIVLPLIARANLEIRAQRALLEQIIAAQAQGSKIAQDRMAWLDALAGLYDGDTDDLAELRDRVDEVPPSLAIAQAIDESGWGTAPLALQANDLFGEHAPVELDRGYVRVPGTAVEVAAFSTLLDSVLAYMTNINRHPAYAKLRALRAQIRRAGRRLDGYALAAGLADYSARGMDYVKALRRLILEHKLHLYDRVHLDTAGGTILIHAEQ